MRKLSELIKLDKYTNKIQEPSLTLKTRNFDIIGKISKYTNWSTSFVGNGLDEISFEVHKYINGKPCPVWDDLIDLKVVNVDDYKNFEIQVEYTDSTETIKSVHGVSLETELGQLYLNDFHVNDEEATSAAITEYNKEDFDAEGKFIPTVLYNKDDPRHSLLHRVLKDKAPHWSIGHVTPYVTLTEDDEAELVERFQRTYTVDGETIYDFLTGTVAPESNVIFIFDTINRRIDCYSLCDCYVKDGDLRKQVCSAIGEDTKVLISKKKLANEISISSNKDSVKNCFRIEGGDDVITDMIRAVNMNGSNYIYQFADFQYNDMPENLVDAIKSYQAKIYNPEIQNEYYGENGIFTRLCDAYKQFAYLQSEMMPAVSSECPFTNSHEQYEDLKSKLTSIIIGVSSTNNYDDNLFVGVTNNIEAMAQILIDSRYTLEIIKDTTSYNSSTKEWTGTIQIKKVSDETDYYPKSVNGEFSETITVSVNDDKSDPLNLPYTRQKIDKALAKGDMSLVDYDADQLHDEDPKVAYDKKYEYFDQYCQSRLQSFLDGYNSCLSVLMSGNVESEIKDTLYKEYKNRFDVVNDVLTKRNEEVAEIEKQIGLISEEQIEFQKELDFYTYLENVETGLYEKFCAYRREDTYSNSNYISDGLETTSELIAKAQELLKVSEAELKKACVLQRTVSASLNNLFALKEFEPLYDSFDLFNYIRVQTEDELLKLRLIGVDISGDSLSDINVTFSEQVETVDGNMTDLESIIQQASSIASSYSSTALQAKQGSEARNRIAEIYSSGLNAANTMLKNSDNNEVTISASGIIAKRMDDEGFYGEKALRIIGNGIYMTEDNWATVAMAIGEIPNEDGSDTYYGVIAEQLIGKMIAGEKLIIGNENGTVSVTGEGITIKNGLIQSANYEENVSGSMLDLTNGTFNYAGGNLTYSDDVLSVKGKIYANGGTFDGNITSNATIVGGKLVGSEITNGNNFSVDKDGNMKCSNADIEGKITATSGTFTGDITSGSTITGSTINGGSIIIGSNFGVDSSGNMNCSNATISGVVNATGGTFTNTITCKGTISGGNLSGSTISGGSITIGNNFSVNTSGNMIAKNASISGTVTAEDFTVWDAIKMQTSITLPPSTNTIMSMESGLTSEFSVNQTKLRLFDAVRVGENVLICGKNNIGYGVYGKSKLILNSNSSYVKLESATASVSLTSAATASLRPDDDYGGSINLGHSDYHWKQIYCDSGSITLSDETKKENIHDISEKYENLFFKVIPKTYKLKDTENVTHDRIHMGAISQGVEKAMQEVGLEPYELSFFCKDLAIEAVENADGSITENPVLDENGNEIYNYALRYQEWIMLNTHMIQKAYKIIETQQEEINKLKAMIN